MVSRESIDANNMVFWPLQEYEEKICYYNTILRFGLFYKNDNACEEIGFDHCNNCAIENYIWESYRKINPQFIILPWIKLVGKILRVKIKDRKGKTSHGHLFI
jgi:hypothetical protein